MKIQLISLFVLSATLVSQAQPWIKQWPNQQRTDHKLKIGPQQRFLYYQDGKPFFYLGDTAWELFHKLDRDEADYYLEDRAEKGFTVIQAVILAQLGGLSRPNPYDQLPLIDQDPDQPNDKYFDQVDYIVKKAASLGLVIGMLPTWGSYWKVNPDNDNLIFDTENARSFGQYLGKRYKDQPVIWILGGDAFPGNDQEIAIIEAMANGLKEGDQGNHLITFHPRGPGRSSDYFHQADWLDFNMYQSSHAAEDFDNGLFAQHDYVLTPVKPTIDGEPRYEQIMVGFYYRGNNQLNRFQAFDARTAAYWSLLGGAFGHTYGNNNIWQMWKPEDDPVIGANTPWYEALDHPGAFDMMLIRRLFESRPFELLRPTQKMIVDGPDQSPDKIRAALAEDGSFAFVYSPRGKPFTLDMDVFSGNQLIERWYDPRYGTSYFIHQGGNAAIKTYTPPTSGRGNDWVLVLDVLEKNYPEPGQINR
ncbi:MAG: glycoside hydrolase family 140 protein [Candidatus Cyclobacteriaceae bacterium M3_2C_046]